MKRKLLVVIMIVALLAVGCSQKQNANGGRNQAQRAVPVEVKKATSEQFREIVSLSGRLEAKDQIDLTSKASGRIKETLVKVGDTVKAGQAIARLDEAEGSIQLQRSEASLLAAKARYEDAKTGTSVEALAQTQNQLTDLQHKYDESKKELTRTEALFKEGAVSADQVEQARSQLITATTNLENQKQKLKEQQKGPTQATLDSASAQLKQSQADYALAQIGYQNLIIKSPFDGVIGSLSVTRGDAVSGNTVVAQIINLSTMKVKSQVSESQVGFFRNGQSVDVNIQSIDLKTKGTIVTVSPLADSTKSYPIEIEISNADGRAKVGMTASIEASAEPRNSLVVPREAVLSQKGENYVYVVQEDKAKKVNVKVGESDGQRIEILSGLSGGEDVVVKGQNMLVPDATVAIFDPNKPVEHKKSGDQSNPAKQNKKQQNG